ncbi:MAG: hypothetical protein WA734_05800 [Candidatus Acidiferrales bacterium]
MAPKTAGLQGWFFISGCVGVLVALGLVAATSYYELSPALLLALWPFSIVGLTEPSTLSGKIFVGVFEFGGNFILYALLGTIVGGALSEFARAEVGTEKKEK